MANELRPQPGAQERFLATPADIAIYGGAAGGGKSFALLLDVLRYVDRVPGFTAIYFRRTYPQLTAPDGLWDLSQSMFRAVRGTPRSNVLDWEFPNRSRVVMSHLQHAKDIYSHQGAQYAGIYFDEMTHFTSQMFWYLLSRNRSVSGVRPYIRGTCNPDPDSFVASLISWWIDDEGYARPDRSGVLRWFVREQGELVWADSKEELKERLPHREPLSLTFIGATLDDNPALLRKDPGYRARLDVLDRVERARLLGGNWLVRPAAGLYFKRHWLPVFDELPGTVEKDVRAWDKAATEPSSSNTDPDWTRGVRMAKLRPGAPVRYIIRDVASIRANPGEVDRLMRNIASQDGKMTHIATWQDPGAAGVADVAHTRRNLDGYRVSVERASQSKVTYAGPFSSACEGGLVGLMRGDWNESYLGELEGFPEAGHDDQVDASSLAYLQMTSAIVRRASPAPAGGASRWKPL